MTPLRPITNRGGSGKFAVPADGWFLIAPKGEFPHESGKIQVIDDDAVNSMASAFRPGDELLIDWEHESHDQNKRTAAAGWIQNLAARTEGLFAQIRWSKSGAEAVQGGEYRFISPVWRASDCQSLGGSRVRPQRLCDAGLTNRPNLQGIAALANRESAGNETADESAENQTAAVLFANAVRNIQASRGWSFILSWEAARAEHASIFANALREQPITNRADKETLIPSHTWPGGVNPYVRFNGIVQSHAAVQRINYERAYDACKLSHPNEFAQMIAEYERDERTGRNAHTL